MMPLDFIKCIQDAESVISSSLHGIIFAESLGIPAKWLSTINGEDELKYYDYYFGTDRYNVKRFITIDSALKSEPMELPKFRFEEYIKTFPKNIKRELRGDLFNQSNSCFDQAFGWYRESSENLGIASYYSTKSLILFRGDKYFDGLYNLFLACKSYRNCSYFLDSDIIGGINRISSFYLGLGGFYDFSNSVISKFEVKYQNYSRFNFVVNFIHSFFDEMSQNERNLDLVKLLNAVKKMAQFKSVDIDCEWLVVMAYLNNIKGDKELEVGFLREAYSKDEKRFWEFYEVVYRFMYPVPELFNFLTCEGDESDEKKHNFFPRIQ